MVLRRRSLVSAQFFTSHEPFGPPNKPTATRHERLASSHHDVFRINQCRPPFSARQPATVPPRTRNTSGRVLGTPTVPPRTRSTSGRVLPGTPVYSPVGYSFGQTTGHRPTAHSEYLRSGTRGYSVLAAGRVLALQQYYSLAMLLGGTRYSPLVGYSLCNSTIVWPCYSSARRSYRSL